MTANIWAHIRSVRSDSRGTSSAFSHWYKSSQLLWHSAWVNQVEGLSAIVMCQQECWASRDPFSSGAIQPQTGALRPTEWNKQQFSLECIRDTFRLEGRLLQAGLANRENDKINSCFFLEMIHFWSFDRNFRFCFRLFCKHTWTANHDEAATNEPPNLDWKKNGRNSSSLCVFLYFILAIWRRKKKKKHYLLSISLWTNTFTTRRCLIKSQELVKEISQKKVDDSYILPTCCQNICCDWIPLLCPETGSLYWFDFLPSASALL